jgi:hypothetical protein
MKYFISLIIMLFLLSACGGGGDDNGTCTILKRSGSDVVIDDISLEACQERFISEPGASGWKWEPNG